MAISSGGAISANPAEGRLAKMKERPKCEIEQNPMEAKISLNCQMKSSTADVGDEADGSAARKRCKSSSKCPNVSGAENAFAIESGALSVFLARRLMQLSVSSDENVARPKIAST